MFGFAHSQYLYLLLLLPVLAGLFLLARRAQQQRLSRLGKLAVIGQLMPERSKFKPWIRLGIELLLLAMVVLVIARPRAGAKVTNSTLKGIEVIVALDVSNSMDAASDNDQQNVSRLQRSKLILEKLIDKLEGNKVGLIVFAGNAYMQMPLTGDAQSAKMYLSSINTSMVPTQGTAIGAAIKMAQSAFSNNPKTQKSVILITDAENFEDDAVGAATEARKQGIQVNVLGIGSTSGSPIPTANGGYLADESGKQVLTRLDENVAQQIAKAGKGAYINGASSNAADQLQESLETLAKSDLGAYTFSQQDEQFPVFAWIALLLLVADILLLDRKNPWLKRYNFFTKTAK